MRVILHALLRLFGIVFFTLLARAILLSLNHYGVYPEQWVAQWMVSVVTMGVLESIGWGLAGVCGVIGLIAWEWLKLGNRIAELLPEARTVQRTARQRLWIKNQLGAAIEEGSFLYAQSRTADEEEYKQRVQKWVDATGEFIQRALGEGELRLFLSSSGFNFYVSSQPNEDTKVIVDGRLRRLTQLIERMDSISVK